MIRPVYREEPCRSALNPVKGMPFKWSLNPYMGCAHRCTYCYVRGYERRADRPSGEEYGQSVRVKTNVAEVLRQELARRSWRGEGIAIGAATDPYQPVEGYYRLTRKCLEVLTAARNPFSIITRGPMIIRDIDVLQEASRRAEVHITFSVPTLDPTIWRRTEPGTAPPRQRLPALRALVDAGINAGLGIAPSPSDRRALRGRRQRTRLPDRPRVAERRARAQLEELPRQARPPGLLDLLLNQLPARASAVAEARAEVARRAGRDRRSLAQ